MKEENEIDEGFNDLFTITDPKEELFVFEDIEIYESTTGQRKDLPFSFQSLSFASNTLPSRQPTDCWLAVKFSFLIPTQHLCSSVMWMGGMSLRCDASGEISTELYRTLFSIGMCVLTWFWMGFSSQKILIHSRIVSQLQFSEGMKAFWTESLNGILAEFLYVHRNLLSFTEVELFWGSEPMEAVNESIQPYVTKPVSTVADQKQSNHSILVPIGGGKDSLVVWHLAQESLSTETSETTETNNKPWLLYVNDEHYNLDVNHRLQDLLRLTDCPYLIIRHTFQSETFLKYSHSYFEPCGHPWAALVLFDSLLIALLTDTREISFGFEKSADEGNAVYLANQREVNHQYDKSSAFLQLASQYVKEAISAKVKIFSPLMNLWELEIARIFCQTPALHRFHPIFMSCNEPIHQGVDWCLKCEKCAFIYLLLSAWLAEEYIHRHILPGRENMFRNNHLTRKVFLSLFGKNGAKPFECVGTIREAKLALCLTVWRYLVVSKTLEPDLPEILKELCEFVALPWQDSDHWHQFTSENDVLQYYDSHL